MGDGLRDVWPDGLRGRWAGRCPCAPAGGLTCVMLSVLVGGPALAQEAPGTSPRRTDGERAAVSSATGRLLVSGSTRSLPLRRYVAAGPLPSGSRSGAARHEAPADLRLHGRAVGLADGAGDAQRASETSAGRTSRGAARTIARPVPVREPGDEVRLAVSSAAVVLAALLAACVNGISRRAGRDPAAAHWR